MNRCIIYWKWEKSVLENDRYKTELREMCERSSFRYLYISFHHLGVPYDDKQLYDAIAETSSFLKKSGRGLILDIDVRNEFIAYQKAGGKKSIRIGFCTGKLDENGTAKVCVKDPLSGRVGRGNQPVSPSEIYGAWCFAADRQNKAVKSTVHTPRVTLKKEGGETEFSVDGGRQSAGYRFVVAARYDLNLPDVFSDSIYPLYDEMFRFYRDLPLDGVANDEWGQDLILEYNCDTGIYWAKMFPYSDEFEREFSKEYGHPLKENLLYFACFVQGEEEKTYQFINEYLECFRSFMKKNNDWFYNESKRVFGEDIFIGVHCTFWGDPYDFSVDILHNGIDWWEVRRDISQTDEYCILPIRLALMHKWGSPYWYNMWYSGNTQQIHTYYEETWRNVRFGGRTDYLGYECVNEPGVVKLRNQGYLEAIDRMEKQISEIDDHVKSQPDSSLLILFGMESVSNWMVAYGEAQVTRGRGTMTSVLQYANAVFSACNCDLVPTSEVVNGSVRLAGRRVRYGSQEYDAVIFVSPEGVHSEVLGFLQKYALQGGKLAVLGKCSRLFDGEDAKDAFDSLKKSANFTSDELITPQQTVSLLEKWGVATNRVPNGCIYRDGTVVLTPDAVLPADNYFESRFTFEGHDICFKGNDYLVLNFRKNICAFGSGSKLIVDGKQIESFAFRNKQNLAV